METHYRCLITLLLVTTLGSFTFIAKDETFVFRTTSEQLGHLRRPWQTYSTQKRGICRIDTSEHRIIVIDTVEYDTTCIVTTTDVHEGIVYSYTSRDTVITLLTDSAASNVLEQLLRITSYAAELLLHQHASAAQTETTRLGRIHRFAGHNGLSYRITQSINNNRIARVDVDHYSQIHGDVTVSYVYDDSLSTVDSPKYVHQNIRASFRHIPMYVTSCAVVSDEMCRPYFPSALPRRLFTKGRTQQQRDSITIVRHSQQVLIAQIPTASSRVFIFEFASFLLVAGAPLSPENGERILDELHRLLPQKPVRYFAPGHHHPHYVGGLRPFVHAGASIICTSGDSSYYRYLSNAQHFSQPDRLQLSPRPPVFFVVDDSLTIRDGTELSLFNIGSLSAHCDNFYVFYLPVTRELFQDELLWIRENTVGSAEVSPRQRGLVAAISKLSISVSKIYQSWPTHRGLLLDVDAAMIGLK